MKNLIHNYCTMSDISKPKKPESANSGGFIAMLRSLLLLCAGFLALSGSALAQESVQINVLNVPGVLPSPYISDIENDVRGGFYEVQVNYLTASAQPVELEFEIRLYRNNNLLVEEVSEPVLIEPDLNIFAPIFDDIFIDRSFQDVINDLDSELRRQIIQTGALPEGNYRLEIDARPLNGSQLMVTPGIAQFTVTYPQPPQLVTPRHEEQVITETPVFSWTTVLATDGSPVEYEFYLVELLEGQSPEEGIDANRPHHDEVLIGNTNLVYTPDLFPLEEGRKYAWQITASGLDQPIPIRNEGESEVFSFTYMSEDPEDGDLEDIERIALIPGTAYIINPLDLEIEQLDGMLEFSGPAVIKFVPGYLPEPVRVEGMASGIRLPETAGTEPVMTGGFVSMDMQRPFSMLIPDLDGVTLERIEFRFGEGFTAFADVDNVSEERIPVQGLFNLTPQGPEGVLEGDTRALPVFENDMAALEINRIGVNLGSRRIMADAGLMFMDQQMECPVSGIDLGRSSPLVSYQCDTGFAIPLSTQRDYPSISMESLQGSFTLDRENNALEHELRSRWELAFDFENKAPCGVRIRGSFESGEGAEFSTLSNTCGSARQYLNLGFAGLDIYNINLEDVSYESSTGDWDYEVEFSAELDFPLFGWSVNPGESFILTPNGLSVPAISRESGLPDYRHDLFDLALQRVDMPEFVFPFQNYDDSEAGPWNLTFDADVNLAETEGLPSCFLGANLEIQNGEVTNGSLSADMALNPVSNCSITLLAGHEIVLNAVGGSISAIYDRDADPRILPDASFNAEGHYNPGYPLTCEDGDPANQQLSGLRFSEGAIVGEMPFSDSGCGLPIGPFDSLLDDAILVLDEDGDGQKARFEADASLQFRDRDVAGSLAYDILETQFIDLDFVIDRPFTWDVPSDEPVLEFEINQARIDLDGVHIDGRNTFNIGRERIGTTFDDVTHELESRAVSAGEIHFDQNFGFVIDFGEGLDSPKFQAVPISEEGDTPQLPAQGLYAELGSGVRIDSTGIRTSGAARAVFSMEELSFGDVEAEFSEDFSFRLQPFGISDGRIDFYYDEQHIAVLNSSGLTPLISGIVEDLIPEKLPAPSTSVAYFVLRDQAGELLVDVNELAPGQVQLSTRPGADIELVVPALDSANPPVAGDVMLDDFVISAIPGEMGVLSGSASVNVDEDQVFATAFERLGLPFELKEIIFGESDAMSDDGSYLQLLGDIVLFDTQVSDAGEAMLQISQGGNLSGNIDLVNLDASIPLQGDSDLLSLRIAELTGSVTLPVFSGERPDFAFSVYTEIELGEDADAEGLAELGFNYYPDGLTVIGTAGIRPDNPVSASLGDFSLELREIKSVPYLAYDSETGWDWKLNLDAAFAFDPADSERFSVPFDGMQISREGISIPELDLNNSSLNGYNLPSLSLAGFEFQLLALRTSQPVTFNWFDGELPEINPELDFELHLPDLAGGALNPPDGLTFRNVSITDGYLTGEMLPFTPLDPIEVPLSTLTSLAPTVAVSSVSGALETVEEDGVVSQDVTILLDGLITDIPFFEDEEAGCVMDVSFSVGVVAGEGFQGNIDDFEPCGSLTAGPAELSAGPGTLILDFSEGEQEVLFEGSLSAMLDGPTGLFEAQGNITLDLLQGEITDGSVQIGQAFNMNIPENRPDPLMTFVVNEAELNNQGFMIDAAGELDAGDADVSVTFNQLAFGLREFSITSGSAVIDAGFGLRVGIDPLSAAITGPPAGDLQDDNALIVGTESSVILDQDGLNFEGGASASLFYGGETFVELSAQFEDSFAYSLESPQVERGRAMFYTAEDQLIAEYSPDGFSFSDLLVGLLPDTLGLPSSDIAYVELTDDDGEPLIDVSSNENGGFTLTTNGDVLTAHFPALEEDGVVPTAEMSFTLTTDDQYRPNGGDITMQTTLDLEPGTGLPLTVDSVAVEQGDANSLFAQISVELPEVFGDETATVSTTINSSGIAEATLEAGEIPHEFDPDTAFLIERSFGSDDTAMFQAGLYGLSISLGGSNEVELAAALKTSVMQGDEASDFPLFVSAGYVNQSWDFQADVANVPETAGFGEAEFVFNEDQPVSITAGNGAFVVGVSGSVSFEEMLGEPLLFSLSDLEVGVENLGSSPSLVMRMGDAAAEIPDQEFSFFEGRAEGNMNEIEISFSDGVLAATSGSGDFTFIDETVEYEQLMASTDGEFSTGDVSSDEVEILGEYLRIVSAGLERKDGGLAVNARLAFLIPDPVDRDGLIDIVLSRDAISGDIGFSTDIPEASEFDPTADDDIIVELGSQISLRINNLLLDVDPDDVSSTHLAMTGAVSINGEERIELGDAGDPEARPGISVRGDRPNLVEYDITGNTGFSFERTLLEIDIFADVASSSSSVFEIVLNGEAGINLPGFSGSAGYEGLTITSEGFDSMGSLAGNASFDLLEIFRLDLGSFESRSEDDAFPIEVPAGFDLEMDDLADAEESTRTIEVVDYLCFGLCEESSGSGLSLSLGGETNSDDATFSGSVQRVQFYRKADGSKSFTVDNFDLNFDDSFTASASLMYDTSGGDMVLRAAATASFSLGGSTTEGMIAGTFARRDGDLSFGLFAAVSADRGFDVAPPILAISGFGGGFFYRPSSQDLDFVINAADSFRGDPPGDLQRVTSGRPSDSANFSDDVEIRFGVMLFAEMDMIGAGGRSLISGSVFLEVTNLNIALDADGHLLGMDGSPMMAGGVFFAGVSRVEEFRLQINLEAELEMIRVLSGGAKVEFILSDTPAGVQWGLRGEFEVDLLGGIFSSGGNRLLASNDGFLLEVGMGAGLSIGPFSISGSIDGSVWYLTYDAAEMPLGAYTVIEGSVDIVILSGSAELQAAFVKKGSSDYEFFGMGSMCGRIGPRFSPIRKCFSPWIRIKTQPSISRDWGRSDPGPDANLVRRAKQQADQFEDMVAGAIEDLEAQIELVPAPSANLSDEQLARAGYNLRRASETKKQIWHFYKMLNESQAGNTVPSALGDSYAYGNASSIGNYFDLGFRDDSDLESDPHTSWIDARSSAEQLIADLEDIASDVTGYLGEVRAEAIELESEVQDLQDELIQIMSSSPVAVTSDPPDSLTPGNPPEFDVDEQLAMEQSGQMENLTEVMEDLEEQVALVADAIEYNLDLMDQLLLPDGPLDGDLPPITQINEQYAKALTAVDRYFAVRANRYWHRIWVTELIKADYQQGGSNAAAIDEVVGHMIDAYENREADPETWQQEREMMAERVRIMEQLSTDATTLGTPYNFSGYTEAEMLYDALGEDGEEFHIQDEWHEDTEDLWVNIHTLGGERYVIDKTEYITQSLRVQQVEFRSTVEDMMTVNSNLIDDFYDLKSNMLVSLYQVLADYTETREAAAEEHGFDLDADPNYEDFAQRRDNALAQLETPQITHVSADVNHTNPDFFSYADIQWSASHPSGIASYSIQTKESAFESESPELSGPFLNIGNPDSFRYYSYLQTEILPDSDQATRQVDGALIARSNGGVMARRNFRFDMAVTSNGNSTSSGQNLLPSETSPPAEVLVELDHFYERAYYSTFLIEDPFNPSGLEGAVDPPEAYFTSSPEVIELRALVDEPESSVANYYYYIGTQPGEDDVREITDLLGDVTPYPDVPGQWTEMLNGQTQIVSMDADQPYFISVQAFNENDQGAEMQVAFPVVYDDTPPTQPGTPEQAVSSGNGGFVLLNPPLLFPGSNPMDYLNQYDEGTPEYSISPTNQLLMLSVTDEKPSYGEISWAPSNDEISGLKHYEFILTDNETADETEFEAYAAIADTNEVTLISGENGNPDFSFRDDSYIHLRAVNHAGLVSEISSSYLGYPEDPVQPDDPEIKVVRWMNQHQIYITRRSYSPTSGISGHQFAIGSQPGQDDIRSWPDEGDLDNTMTGILNPGNMSHAPLMIAFNSQLPEGEPFYISVRGVGETGLYSEPAIRGPFIIDTEPPESPTVSIKDENGPWFNLEIENIQDPVSGISSVELKVLHHGGSSVETLQDWGHIEELETVQNEPFSINRDIYVGFGYEIEDLEVKIRITNSAGLETVVTEGVQPISLPPFELPPGNLNLTF